MQMRDRDLLCSRQILSPGLRTDAFKLPDILKNLKLLNFSHFFIFLVGAIITEFEDVWLLYYINEK